MTDADTFNEVEYETRGAETSQGSTLYGRFLGETETIGGTDGE